MAARKILSALKQDPESLSIYADLSEIPQKGTYEVPLRANIASARGVTILSITPSTATLRVDQQTTLTFLGRIRIFKALTAVWPKSIIPSL